MKVCRNALNERLPDNVKEYLKNLNEGQRISSIIDLNDVDSNNNINNVDSNRETLIKLNNDEKISNINNSKVSNNKEFLEEDN